MNFMTMMMAMPTNRGKRLIKMLERLLKQDHLYSDDEIKTIKSQLRVVKEELAKANSISKKGFGS
jgi:phosphomevalonate kinase